MATPSVIPRKVQSIGITLVKCNMRSPIHPVIGPGRTGKNEPITPNKTKKNPTKSKKISMCFISV
jgi:hypothetical protein